MPKRHDPRHQALTERLAQLKGVVLGLSASAAVGLWWLVSSTVAATQATGSTTTPTTTTPTTTTTRPDRDDDGGFFNGGQGSSLGSGSAGTFGSGPSLRSGGS